MSEINVTTVTRCSEIKSYMLVDSVNHNYIYFCESIQEILIIYNKFNLQIA